MVDFRIVELSCKFKRILYVLCALCGKSFAEGVVRITVSHVAGGVHYLPNAAEPIMEVEVNIILRWQGVVVDVVLGQYLAVSVDVLFHNIHIICRIQLH